MTMMNGMKGTNASGSGGTARRNDAQQKQQTTLNQTV